MDPDTVLDFNRLTKQERVVSKREVLRQPLFLDWKIIAICLIHACPEQMLKYGYLPVLLMFFGEGHEFSKLSGSIQNVFDFR